jgi:hypothetical protein
MSVHPEVVPLTLRAVRHGLIPEKLDEASASCKR